MRALAMMFSEEYALEGGYVWLFGVVSLEDGRRARCGDFVGNSSTETCRGGTLAGNTRSLIIFAQATVIVLVVRRGQLQGMCGA